MGLGVGAAKAAVTKRVVSVRTALVVILGDEKTL